MRGLTAQERATLALAVTDIEHAVEVGEEIYLLVAQGRARKCDEDADNDYFKNTDLGALALRVCPVE